MTPVTINAAERAAELLTQFSAPDADVAWLLCDRHPPNQTAFTVVGPMGTTKLTYRELATESQRRANALASLGVQPGDRVASLMGKSVDLVTTVLAIWRLGAVYVPLFTAFGASAIALRLEQSSTRVVVVDADQRHKLDPSDDLPEDPDLRIVIAGHGPVTRTGDQLLADLTATAPIERDRVAVGGDGALVHMFTSGTTGKPKGVVHPVVYLAGWQIYLEYALGLTPEDTFWSAADPGWAYGLYTAIAAPMAAGVPSLLLAGGFSAEATWSTLSRHGVTNFAAAPTVYRSLRASGLPVPGDLQLRMASSAGEPLTPEVNEWARLQLGLEVHDHFGQTETGMVLANHHHPELARAIKPGSMGRSGPGWAVTVLDEQRDEPAQPGDLGRVAIEIASPLMTFQSYQGATQATGRFTDDHRFYLTGDTARIDVDGDFFFSARDDDVIIMAGYRIGPFDIESVLAQHPAVAECCVIAAPDEVRGEVIEAFVVTRPEHAESAELAVELQQLVKSRYAAHAYPRTVHFIAELPKTPSGKVQRYLLRTQRTAQGHPELTR